MSNISINNIFIFCVSFLLSVLLAVFLIPFLRWIKFGQTVRDDGPASHLKKMGVPTMGGIIFLFPAILISVCNFHRYPYIIPLAFSMVTFSAIGFVDDYIKVIMKRKDGLFPKQKSFLQIIAAAIFAVYVTSLNIIDNVIYFPNFKMYIPKFMMVIFIIILFYTMTNAVNLTDGVDGLATSVTIVVLLAYIIFSLRSAELEYIRIFCISLLGGCLGFLLFNKYPASVIMGDMGSLGLGGAVCAMTILLKVPFILAFVGIIYIAEALSVVIQVASFKLRGKRVFKMSPIHHHFELVGWKETKVVKVFVAVTFIFSVVGIILYYMISWN